MKDGDRLIVTLGQARGMGGAWAENLCLPAEMGEAVARRWYARTQGSNAKAWSSLAASLKAELGMPPAAEAPPPDAGKPRA
ncbi:MAG: hypothetical protein REJ50_24885 [Bordetella sp.]|nr:hypothetical protein [Bordetella sp.]